MTGGVEGWDWWVERMDDDCECTEGEGVMIGGGSGGAEGEEAFSQSRQTPGLQLYKC